MRPRGLRAVLNQLPRLGLAGSRSSQLHADVTTARAHDLAQRVPLSRPQVLRLQSAAIIGTLGSLLIAVGGWGSGAMPVVGNPLWEVPGISVLARMLHTSTVTTFLGIGLLVSGWVAVGTLILPMSRIPSRTFWRLLGLWVTPLIFTAPLFTQDIYSYLAQGSIAAHGMDPYSAGPVDLLGVEHPLARSVPLLWAHSPSPYGPVAMGVGAVISWITSDAIALGVVAHRLVSIAGLLIATWALVRLARRCSVPSADAMWLGVLNPLTILHLVGGIHNESIMLGLLLAGMELVLRGVDGEVRPTVSRWILIIGGMGLISAAGLVKVTALVALGFAGVAVARWFGGSVRDLLKAALLAVVVAAVTFAALSFGTGVGFGWVFVQGGATEVTSWMSITTVFGLISSALGMLLGLGDHQAAALALFRLLGVLVGAFWLLRMLLAAFRGRIHPVGGYGVAMFFLVVFFPVVHPWYLLWAIVPLAAWANRWSFRIAVIVYSIAFSFFILPRGLTLPPGTVALIYSMAGAIFAVLVVGAWLWARRRPQWAEAFHVKPSRKVRSVETRIDKAATPGH